MNQQKSDPRKFWGPCLWKSIHSLAAAYDPHIPGAADAYVSFIHSLVYTLPCKACREHLKQNLERHPIEPYLTSNDQLFLWSYHLHDLVNRQLGRKSPPYLEVKRIYFSSLGMECPSCSVV